MILVLTEAALELVPEDISNHPSVLNHAKRRRKAPTRLLLDRSYHHRAMRNIDMNWKRGRPDIIHISLLEALGTPLFKRGYLQIYIHTHQNFIIKVYPNLRLPRNFDRFVGVIEQLFEVSSVPQNETPLLTLKKGNLKSLIDMENPSHVIALSTEGKLKALKDICTELGNAQKPLFLIGGFPKGHFKKETLNLTDSVYKVSREHLETWVITSRLIYTYELEKNFLY